MPLKWHLRVSGYLLCIGPQSACWLLRFVIYEFSKYLLSTTSVPGIMLGAGDPWIAYILMTGDRQTQSKTQTPGCNRAAHRKIKWARGIERGGVVDGEDLSEVTFDQSPAWGGCEEMRWGKLHVQRPCGIAVLWCSRNSTEARVPQGHWVKSLQRWAGARWCGAL